MLEPVVAGCGEIAQWSAALIECRSRTLKSIARISQAELDWEPPTNSNTIGALLYHIALIEADWLYTEILQHRTTADLGSLFPAEDRESDQTLTKIRGGTGNQHERRLALVRQELLRALSTMTLAEFRRVRHMPDYDVTPEWVVLHLLQHEAEHRGQIISLRGSADRSGDKH